jgi:hypothetical protein
MSVMKRVSLLAATAALVAAAAPGSASAKVIELGVPSTALTPPPACTTTGGTSATGGKTTCPHGADLNSYTILQTQVTSLETIADGKAYPTTAPSSGRIVAFTVALSALDTNTAQRRLEIHVADSRFSGTTQVAITVLRRVGKARNRNWKVVAESPPVHVQPYLGMVVQFPLETTLPIQKNDVVALTTPTWAPVLQLFQSPKKAAYRQSRRANCGNPPASTQAQLTIGQSAQYMCNYPGIRVEYSATEITTTPYPKNYVHAGDATARGAWYSQPFRTPFSGGAGLLR